MTHVVLDKKIGQTPLQAIEEWKAIHPEYADIPATYAGRLDPMAEGLLLVLFGEECKKKDRYIGLDKEYVVEVLLGVGSDTGDVLGIVQADRVPISLASLSEILHAEVGTHQRAYPAFSSKTVAGKPLFLYALEGTIDTISIPEHPETIYGITLSGTEDIDADTLRARISQLLALAPKSDEPSKSLGADFRIDAVRSSWDAALSAQDSYTVLNLTVSCGSGAYMRTLAERIGAALSTHALALSIRRTRIGDFISHTD